MREDSSQSAWAPEKSRVCASAYLQNRTPKDYAHLRPCALRTSGPLPVGAKPPCHSQTTGPYLQNHSNVRFRRSGTTGAQGGGISMFSGLGTLVVNQKRRICARATN